VNEHVEENDCYPLMTAGRDMMMGEGWET